MRAWGYSHSNTCFVIWRLSSCDGGERPHVHLQTLFAHSLKPSTVDKPAGWLPHMNDYHSLSLVGFEPTVMRGKCFKVSEFNYFIIIIEGFVVGILTGLVGAGGGFLIIPALVLFANLPMKRAVATSLMIISIKSLIGFLGDIGNIEIDWEFLLMFSILSIIGIIIGIYLSNFIDGKKIKKAFGWFVLVMAIYIIYKEILF